MDNLSERVNKLLNLSFEPDSNSQTRITDPVFPIERKLKAGQFNPKTEFILSGFKIEAFEYYVSYFNLSGKSPTKKVVHLYSPIPPVGTLENDSGTTYIVHSHEFNQYCPWKGGCHSVNFGYGTKKPNFQKWFIDLWSEFYGW